MTKGQGLIYAGSLDYRVSWKLKIHKKQPDLPQIGDVWLCTDCIKPEHKEYYVNEVLSNQYFKEWSRHRLPLYVLLPDGTEFCLDGKAACDGQGWTVRGVYNKITLSPSINILGGYHGFIKDGILTSDCEGRKFLKNSDNEIVT